MFRKVLIANRGVIACRIIRTLRRMGVAPVAVYSEADREALHVAQADEAVWIGPAPAAESYLSMGAILDAAKRTGAEAIHPGQGFLSENAGFAAACEAAGIAFIGPTSEQMHALGPKHAARTLAREHGVPLLPGTGLLADASEALAAAAVIGYPVMLKSSAGVGGIGMQLCRSPRDLAESFDAVERLSRAAFGDASLFLEKAVTRARHIEVQVFGDGRGTVLALGERDCSVQRRNQKVIEETPAPGLTDADRTMLVEAAIRLVGGYRSAGTVEFIYDGATGGFYFLEVSTGLQVEEAVTEEVTGIDLVEWMVRLAAGELPPLDSFAVRSRGAAMQARIYAEDPARNFEPCSGRLTEVRWPENSRVDATVRAGTEVTSFYDPMLASIVARGTDRGQALARLRAALDATIVSGVETNLSYLRQAIQHETFSVGVATTTFLAGLARAG